MHWLGVEDSHAQTQNWIHLNLTSAKAAGFDGEPVQQSEAVLFVKMKM